MDGTCGDKLTRLHLVETGAVLSAIPSTAQQLTWAKSTSNTSIHVHAHMHMHTHMHIYTHPHCDTHTRAHMHTRTRTHTCIHTHTRMACRGGTMVECPECPGVYVDAEAEMQVWREVEANRNARKAVLLQRWAGGAVPRAHGGRDPSVCLTLL